MMTRRATLTRKEQGPGGTLGEIVTDTRKTFVTFERPWVDANHDGFGDRDASRVPAGIFECRWEYSRKCMCYRYALRNVPGRSGILIHAGNYLKETLGCILIGEKFTIYRDTKCLALSRLALQAFEKEYDESPFELTIVEAF